MKKHFELLVLLHPTLKIIKEFKIAFLIVLVSVTNVFGANTYSRITEVPLDMKSTNSAFDTQQQISVSGAVTDASTGVVMPGVNIVVKGTTIGTISDPSGRYSLTVLDRNATLIFSFIGYVTQEIPLNGRTTLNIVLASEVTGLEEVVVIGYGTMKKRDLTGSINRADIEIFEDQPNISLMQSVQGTVAGLNVGQVTQAGENPSFTIRGRTSISGRQDPLIVLDGVIYRGSLIDINPDDIEGLDVLKDNSAAAVYGSQASNGVILITSKSGKGKNMRPLINYSASFAFQSPAHELVPLSPEGFIQKTTETDWLNSRTPESGYLEPKPGYSPTAVFKTNAQIENYNAGKSTDWYHLVTNDNIYVQQHNLSLTSKNEFLNYFISVGLTDDQGFALNEKYKRYNARINVDNHVTDWFSIGVQTFASISDYSGLSPSLSNRFRMPFDVAYDDDGKIINLPGDLGVNPLLIADAEDLDIRNNIFGNIYANINIPFIEGLSYKINFANNLITTRRYTFEFYDQGFTGSASKTNGNQYDMSSDNIVNYKRRFNNVHNLDITLLYGFEKRKYDGTNASSSDFINPVLGYNRLQAGNVELQRVTSSAWAESSLYSMGRFFYSFRDKYMITGTIRRDGFSGFSEKNKFGLFPSIALAWVLTEESFFKNISNIVDLLKFRMSYGSTGNRTISRYQTLAQVSGSFQYSNQTGASVYGQEITSLASPNLKWETTTGINLGIDFGILKSRITGSIDYYNNNTTNLLYNVDIPSIGRFSKFPDNLGKINNYGLEISLSSVNISKGSLTWTTDFVFSRDRDKLIKLLGFDNNGDGKEDDLISEGLFIGKPLSVRYDYETTGELYQLGDEIPSWAAVGTLVLVDQNDDSKMDPSDKVILGYVEPAYRFSINNNLRYKKWTLNIYINSIQGGKNYYYDWDTILADGEVSFNTGADVNHFNYNFAKGLDYWLPENPDARYQRIGAAFNPRGFRYIQRNFIRLQDVSLAYNFSSELLNKIKVNKLKFFITGKNLLTLTKWPGWDPETGEGFNRSGKPVLKSYSLGLNIEF